ncbi:sure-like protein [Wolfiporia cocos MD-104 SS10]|uniref:Sure-like protein n=1 Tax=Wolfiporia cocos (strain MD-104) TaxID=742152 RepID=A0A2H3K3K4_WOLCO|nr:sure-like protein [Wolfiporia cocos MD-104 SS10]
MHAARLLVAVFCAYVYAENLVLTNDDGWADAQIRAQYFELTQAGYDVVLSCPAENQSGTGSTTAAAMPLSEPCEYDTCPVGSPAEGYNASNPYLNYVNAYPVDAARYGIQVLAPEFFHGSRPDFVVSGPNIGNNLGTVILISGTMGAACEAAKEGVPSTAFNGATGAQVSYTTLESDPDSPYSQSSWIYSALTVHYTRAILASQVPGIPLLPRNVTVNVNYPPIDNCSEVSEYKWIFSRNLANSGETDIWTCGSSSLPAEADVVATEGCYISVSAINAINKTDVDAFTQGEVYARLAALPFSCLP